MAGIFGEDSKLMGVLSDIFDVLFLGFLWFVFSLPIITIGAASTAAYYTAVKGIRRKRGFIWKNFWKSFRMNFFPATVLWLWCIVADGLFAFIILGVCNYVGGFVAMAVTILCISALIVLLLTEVYFFPVLSRFEFSIKEIIKTSFIMGIKHLLVSIICILILVVNLAVILVSFTTYPFIIVFTGSVFSLIYSIPMEKVLKEYLPDCNEEDHTIDQWYAE